MKLRIYLITDLKIEVHLNSEITGEKLQEIQADTVIIATDDILQVSGLSAANSLMLRELIRYYHIDVRTGTKLCSIEDTGITVSKGSAEEVIPVDSVITAIGYNPGEPLAVNQNDIPETYVIGDADHVGNLMDVIWKAYDVAFLQ